MWECYHSLAPYCAKRGGRIVKHPRFPEFPNECPLSFAVLSASCLAVDPRDRPNFMQICGVLEDLAAHLRGEGLPETCAAHLPMRVLENTAYASGNGAHPVPVFLNLCIESRCTSTIDCCLLWNTEDMARCACAGEAEEARRLTPEQQAMTAISQILSRALPSSGKGSSEHSKPPPPVQVTTPQPSPPCKSSHCCMRTVGTRSQVTETCAASVVADKVGPEGKDEQSRCHRSNNSELFYLFFRSVIRKFSVIAQPCCEA